MTTHTIQDTIKTYLEQHSYARERRFKDKALVELLQEKYGEITPDKLADLLTTSLLTTEYGG